MASSSCSLRTGGFPARERAEIGGESETVGEGVEVDWGRLEGRSNWAIAWRLGFIFKRTGDARLRVRQACRMIR